MTRDLVDYAIDLRSRDFICVPLVKGGKHLDLPTMDFRPLHLQSLRKDLKELAFTSVAFSCSQHPPSRESVARWFRNHDGNIGILGGYKDLVILDFDKAPILERWRRMNARLFDTTPVEQTPKGFHVYLRCPMPRVSSSLHIGMRRAGHIKALGGYIVSAPSTLADGSTYRWLPDQSPSDVAPQFVRDIAALAIYPTSPLKRYYDHVLGRGFFSPQ